MKVTIMPVLNNTEGEWEHNADGMKAGTFLSLLALVDFGFGYVKGHSVFAGVVAMVLGLPLSALLWFIFKAIRKNESKPS